MPVLVAWVLLGTAKGAVGAWPIDVATSEREVEIDVGASSAAGYVPPFRASERRRDAGEVQARWRLHDDVALDLQWAYLRDALPSGTSVSGPGDLVVGTWVRPYKGVVELSLAWQIKLPDARDESELGTDETDGWFWGVVGRHWDRVAVAAAGGLGILGNPLKFANQDDIPAAEVGGCVDVLPGVGLHGRLGGGFQTARNPARMDAALGADLGTTWGVGFEGVVGMTLAAPDVGARLWLTWAPSLSKRAL